VTQKSESPKKLVRRWRLGNRVGSARPCLHRVASISALESSGDTLCLHALCCSNNTQRTAQKKITRSPRSRIDRSKAVEIDRGTAQSATTIKVEF
jgi:hypothetical protein